MWSIIPLIAFSVCWYGFYRYFLNGVTAFLMASAVWGAAVLVLTEVLSLFHAVTFLPLLIGWCLFLAAAIYGACSQKPGLGPRLALVFPYPWALTEKILGSLVLGIVLIKGYSALMSAPNTADALSYHLSRVEHWIQNASVIHYPTPILRQLYYPVMSEYIILHFMVLSGGDHLANMVQWFACLGSLMAVFGLAGSLGADRRGKLLAVLLAVTLPMSLVQATSTQTDYVMTFWLAGFIYLLWDLYQRPDLLRALGCGTCLGLAMLTKGNAYIFSPIWLLIFAAAGFRSPQRSRYGSLLILIIGVAIAINIPYTVRNINTFGSANVPAASLTNASISPSVVASNVLRNAGLHLGTPWDRANQALERGCYHLAQVMGIDLNDANASFGAGVFHLQKPSTGEDDAGNGLYAYLFLIILLLMLLHPSLRKGRYWTYAAALIVMFLFFCTIVRFQPWNSRFHLAIFVLSCALAGTVLAQLWRQGVVLLAIVLLVAAWPWLLACNEHPILGEKSILSTTRVQQYFSESSALILPYALTVQGVRSLQCRDIGLVQGPDQWEYLWWMLLHQVYGNEFRLENVDVHNMSERLEYPKGVFNPCALIAQGDRRTAILLPQGLYVRAWFIDLPNGMTSIFIKDH